MNTRRFVIRSGQDLARTVAESRRERGLTQAQLAARAGVERTYLAKLEAGHVVQQVDRALALLRSLGVEVTAELHAEDV
jgi:transcriptional regulator with XRE-family HTH domain